MRIEMESAGLTGAAAAWRRAGEDVGERILDLTPHTAVYGSADLASAVATFEAAANVSRDAVRADFHDTATMVDGVRDTFNSMERSFTRFLGGEGI